MKYKYTKLSDLKRVKKVKSAVEKYKITIKLLKKKLVQAVKAYKLAVESERMEMAVKNNKKLQSK